MKTITFLFTSAFVTMTLLSCNDAQKATKAKLPTDTMPADISETKKIVPVEIKGDSLNSQMLPVENPK